VVRRWPRRTWKMVRNWSSFFLAEPLSKHMPHVSSRVQMSRTRKKSSAESTGHDRPGTGSGSAAIRRPGRQVRSHRGSVDDALEESRRTVSKGDERPECVKDDGRVDLPEVVELAEELDGRDPALVVLEDVGLTKG